MNVNFFSSKNKMVKIILIYSLEFYKQQQYQNLMERPGPAEAHRRRMLRYIKSITHQSIAHQFTNLQKLNYRVLTESSDLFSAYNLFQDILAHAISFKQYRIQMIRRLCMMIVYILHEYELYCSKLKRVSFNCYQALKLWNQQLMENLTQSRAIPRQNALLMSSINQYLYYCLWTLNTFVKTNKIIREGQPEHLQMLGQSSLKIYLTSIRKKLSVVLQQSFAQNPYKIKLAIQFCILNANWIKIFKEKSFGNVHLFYTNSLKSLFVVLRLLKKFRSSGLEANLEKFKSVLKFICELYGPFLKQQHLLTANNQIQRLYNPHIQKTKCSGIKLALNLATKFKEAWQLLNLNKKRQNKSCLYFDKVKSNPKPKQYTSCKSNNCEDSVQKRDIRLLSYYRSQTLLYRRSSGQRNFEYQRSMNMAELQLKQILNENNQRYRRRAKSACHPPKTKQTNQSLNCKQKERQQTGINLQSKKKSLYLSIRREPK